MRCGRPTEGAVLAVKSISGPTSFEGSGLCFCGSGVRRYAAGVRQPVAGIKNVCGGRSGRGRQENGGKRMVLWGSGVGDGRMVGNNHEGAKARREGSGDGGADDEDEENEDEGRKQGIREEGRGES